MLNYNKSQITYLYGLYEIGKSDKIKYIGKSNNPYSRLKDHKCDKAKTPKTYWIKSIISNGGDIGVKILKVVDYNKWKNEEVKLISEYNIDNKLKNYDKGGNGGKIKYNKTYEECIEWLKINKPKWVLCRKDYKKWKKQKDFPTFLPLAPERKFYNFKWHEYLNTDNIKTTEKRNYYYNYNDAKDWLINNLNLKSSTEYRKTKLPYFIPSKPYNIYIEEWISWSEFLNFKPYKRDKNNIYLSYDDAKKWIDDNFIKLSRDDFNKLSKDDELPLFIPKKPDRYYKSDGFKHSDFYKSLNKKR